MMYGRIIYINSKEYWIQNEQRCSQVLRTLKDPPLSLGDIVQVLQGQCQILTPNRLKTLHWMSSISNPQRLEAMQVRFQIEEAIRRYFLSQNFHEVRTPLLVPCPGMEPHIRPFQIQNSPWYLPTSPEFAMKKLLAGGLEKIFQICPAFRNEPHSRTHRPEFTLLEWYRAYSHAEEIMQDTEALFQELALQRFQTPIIPYQGKKISVKTPWLRLKVSDLFQPWLNAPLTHTTEHAVLLEGCRRWKIPAQSTDSWDDLYFKLWLNCIEPQLPQDQAVFVTHYLPAHAALAVIQEDSHGQPWAQRFELYLGGLELGNGFEELTDPQEQRQRFLKDMALRTQTYGEDFLPQAPDEEFLNALMEGMPPSGGIAIGVDRMIMLYGDLSDIAWTQWFTALIF